jgi:hypothetical protein
MSWAHDSFSPAAPFPQYSRVRSSTAIEIITQWSGRASVQQTRDYIHQDPVRKARKYGSHIIPVAYVTPPRSTTRGPKARSPPRYGICTHPWTTGPCQKLVGCLNCSELLHCKCHKNSLAAVKFEREHVAKNLAATIKEIEAGDRPAKRWVDTHARCLGGLNEIVDMHENPEIPGGSPVQMVGKFSLMPSASQSTSSLKLHCRTPPPAWSMTLATITCWCAF